MASHFVYTVSEFRKKQRSAFEFAQAGATVVIDRYGEKFVLKHVPGEDPTIPDFDEKPTAPPTTQLETVGYVSKKDVKKIKSGETAEMSKTPEGVKNIRLATPIKKEFCANGHYLAPGSSRCLQKGCKYA